MIVRIGFYYTKPKLNEGGLLMDIKITLSKNLKEKPKYGEEAFPLAKVSTDHMFVMDYSNEKGWYDARLIPFEALNVHPFANSLHYGQLVFEGMKAYKDKFGNALMFRPYENANRLNISAKRLSMPEIDPKSTVKAISKLVEIEKDWIPNIEGMSLYIRPFIMATEPTLNVVVSDSYQFIIVLSPFGHFYGGLNPLHIVAETSYIRAAKGGTGFAKCAGNYAGAYMIMNEAKKLGFDQVLWLDAEEHKYIEEVSTMNVFFRIGDTVITPATSDSILSGITRKSVVEILKDWGMNVEERKLSIEEVAEEYKKGNVKEVFCTGTAAVITSIGKITWNNQCMTFNDNKTGELTLKIYDELTGIQLGNRPDTRGWTYKIGSENI